MPGAATSDMAAPLKNARGVGRAIIRSSSLGGEPIGDCPDLVVGIALGDPSHHRRWTLARAKSLHRRNDVGRILAADWGHGRLDLSTRGVAARTRGCVSWRFGGVGLAGDDREHERTSG